MTEHTAVQLVKDYMMKHAHGAVTFYLDKNYKWNYSQVSQTLVNVI